MDAVVCFWPTGACTRQSRFPHFLCRPWNLAIPCAFCAPVLTFTKTFRVLPLVPASVLTANQQNSFFDPLQFLAIAMSPMFAITPERGRKLRPQKHVHFPLAQIVYVCPIQKEGLADHKEA